ncbi:MAG: hypothetical protein WCO09_01215 [bacterium]
MNETMEEDIKEMRDELEDMKQLIEENHKMLRHLHTAYRVNTVVSIIKWTIIIGFTIGAFYYIQPYLENMLKLYGSINSLTGGVENNGGIDILKSLKNSI